eukprot:RCo004154
MENGDGPETATLSLHQTLSRGSGSSKGSARGNAEEGTPLSLSNGVVAPFSMEPRTSQCTKTRQSKLRMLRPMRECRRKQNLQIARLHWHSPYVWPSRCFLPSRRGHRGAASKRPRRGTSLLAEALALSRATLKRKRAQRLLDVHRSRVSTASGASPMGNRSPEQPSAELPASTGCSTAWHNEWATSACPQTSSRSSEACSNALLGGGEEEAEKGVPLSSSYEVVGPGFPKPRTTQCVKARPSKLRMLRPLRECRRKQNLQIARLHWHSPYVWPSRCFLPSRRGHRGAASKRPRRGTSLLAE